MRLLKRLSRHNAAFAILSLHLGACRDFYRVVYVNSVSEPGQGWDIVWGLEISHIRGLILGLSWSTHCPKNLPRILRQRTCIRCATKHGSATTNNRRESGLSKVRQNSTLHKRKTVLLIGKHLCYGIP
jgi:hypothetical protein